MMQKFSMAFKRNLMGKCNLMWLILTNYKAQVPLAQFSTKRQYGGLKDQDRIFTNLYKDGDPFIDGALKRVRNLKVVYKFEDRVIGIKLRTFY